MTPINRQFRPHNSLDDFKQAVIADDGRVVFGKKSQDEMFENGLSPEQFGKHVNALRPRDFNDSQTHVNDHRRWIDSYIFVHDGVDWYMKFHPRFDGPGYFVQKCHPSR